MHGHTSTVATAVADEWRITEANGILKDFYSIACSALGEPSFNVNDWSAIKTIYRRVIERRLEIARSLQRRNDISEDTMYLEVWKDTITTLIELERSGCKAEHEALLFNNAFGPLSHDESPILKTVKSPFYPASSYRFLDMLAEARDELWKEIRPTYHPSATSLQRPWPRGLPIQCLTNKPFDVANPRARGFTPFISSRATEIVFLDTDAALSNIPSDEETQAAIGPFVDHYGVALQTHIMQQPEGPERGREISRAWDHAMTSLTQGRMNAQEATRFWRSHFQHALPGITLDLPCGDDESLRFVKLPTANDENETNEWNPAANQPPAVKPRSLSALAVDSLLAPESSQADPYQPFREPQPQTPPYEPPSILGTTDCDCKSKPAHVQEALIASALLYLDSKENKSSRILTKPFPSETEVRYPSLILDSEFLLRHGNLNRVRPIEILSQLIDRVPATLLLELTSDLLDSSPDPVGSSDASTGSTTAIQLLTLATRCDRPEVVASQVLHTVVDRPEASSWHRRFLSPTFLNRLRPGHASGLLRSLAEAIEVKLGQQRATEEGESQKPVVKVTTIKYLAQLLRKTSFVAPQESLNILVSMLHANTHLDVLYTIVESILAMLAGDVEHDTSALTPRILKELEPVVPIVGRLDEGQSNQRDWAALPVIEDEATSPPIFGLLLAHASDAKLPLSVRRTLVESILLPSFEASRKAHNRWIELFLARNKWNHAEPDLERYLARSENHGTTWIPPRPTVLAVMLRQIPEFLPSHYFQAWHQYTILNLAPDPSLLQFNRNITDPPDSESHEDAVSSGRDSKAERHWLNIYDQGSEVLTTSPLAYLLMNGLSTTVVTNGSTIPFIQQLVLQQARILIHDFDRLHDSWHHFLSPLKPRPWNARIWFDNCKPVVEDLISHVNWYRNNPTWRSSPDRKPSFLPSMFELQMMLLPPFPGYGSGGQAGDQQHADFAKAILDLLKQVLASNKTYHHELIQIQATAFKSLDASAVVNVACRLGDLSESFENSEPSTADYLRVEIAHRMLRGAEKAIHKTQALADQSDRLLAQWKGSKVEAFRMRGCIGLQQAVWGHFDATLMSMSAIRLREW